MDVAYKLNDGVASHGRRKMQKAEKKSESIIRNTRERDT